jgi:hypothetical protein
VASPNRTLALDHHSIPPGGTVIASGQGCTPNATVQLLIDSVPVGTTVANSDGSFSTPLSVSVPLGQHTVLALCGPTLASTIDVVLTSHAGPPTSTAALLLILFLLVLCVIPWQFSQR